MFIKSGKNFRIVSITFFYNFNPFSRDFTLWDPFFNSILLVYPKFMHYLQKNRGSSNLRDVIIDWLLFKLVDSIRDTKMNISPYHRGSFFILFIKKCQKNQEWIHIIYICKSLRIKLYSYRHSMTINLTLTDT